METKASKLIFMVKSCIFIALVAASVNVYANYIYLGNPDRPNTIWIPGHYAANGCWVEGHYLKFICEPKCYDVAWVDGQYDRSGNWMPAHWKIVRPYRIVNPGPDSSYPGFAM